MHYALRTLRSFARQHDDMPAFTAMYLVGTILIASLLSLGWFVLFVFLHMMLDVVKYRDLHGFGARKTLKAVVLENVADVALVFIALTFAVYLHHTFLLAAVSGLMRSQLTVLRALGMIIPETSILQHTLVIGANFHEYMHSVHPDMDEPLTRVQRWSVYTIVTCALLLVLAVPILGGHDVSVLPIIADELSLAF